MHPARRSYLKRKRYLNGTIEEIARTLRQIAHANGFATCESEMLRDATAMAHSVEAACYVSANKSSEDRYRLMLTRKTFELCQTLYARNFAKRAPPPKGGQAPAPAEVAPNDLEEMAAPSDGDIFFSQDSFDAQIN
jgi:hypothetical protein